MSDIKAIAFVGAGVFMVAHIVSMLLFDTSATAWTWWVALLFLLIMMAPTGGEKR